MSSQCCSDLLSSERGKGNQSLKLQVLRGIVGNAGPTQSRPSFIHPFHLQNLCQLLASRHRPGTEGWQDFHPRPYWALGASAGIDGKHPGTLRSPGCKADGRDDLICYLKDCGQKAEIAHYPGNIHSPLFVHKTLALSGVVQLPLQPGVLQKPRNEAYRKSFERELPLQAGAPRCPFPLGFL